MSMHKQTYQSLYNYIAIALGMTSFSYNSITGKHKRMLWTQAFALVANVCTIISLPLIFWNAIKRVTAIQWNPTMTHTNYITYTIRTLVVLYTIIKRSQSDLMTYQSLKKFRRLQSTYLAHFPRVTSIERRMNRLYYTKFTNMCLLIILTAIIFHQTAEFEWTWLSCFIFVMVLQTTAILHMTRFNFFWFLWSICCSLRYVEWELCHLLKQIKVSLERGQRWRLMALVTDMEGILEAHWQLAKLARLVSLNYSVLILAGLMDQITSLVRQFYYGIIFTFDHRATNTQLTIGSLYFCAMIFDMYLSLLVCDITVRTYYASVEKLRCINVMNAYCPPLNEMVERCLLRAQCDGFRLDLHRTITVDKKRWLRIMQRVLYESFTLVQFHLIFNVNKNFS